jgi:hypothetical protein
VEIDFRSHIPFVGLGPAKMLFLTAQMNTDLGLLQLGAIHLADLGRMAAGCLLDLS